MPTVIFFFNILLLRYGRLVSTKNLTTDLGVSVKTFLGLSDSVKTIPALMNKQNIFVLGVMCMCFLFFQLLIAYTNMMECCQIRYWSGLGKVYEQRAKDL